MKKLLRLFLIVCVSLLAVITLIWITGLVTLLRIPTSAMEPTLRPGEHVVFRAKRGLEDTDRERVVYFMSSSVPYLHRIMQRDERVIKRVAGLPGDTVSTDGGNIFINGGLRAVKGNFAKNEHQLDLTTPVVIPEGYFYALGDNDGNSLDSRVHGLVPISGIRGITITEIKRVGVDSHAEETN